MMLKASFKKFKNNSIDSDDMEKNYSHNLCIVCSNIYKVGQIFFLLYALPNSE